MKIKNSISPNKEEIVSAILEGIWIMRWNKTKTAMTAVLTPEEAEKMANDVVKELKKAGFRIIPKNYK